MQAYRKKSPLLKSNASSEYFDAYEKAIQGAVFPFVDEDLADAEGIFVCQAANSREALSVDEEMPDNIFTVGTPINLNRDKQIAVETIASGVKNMVTSNMASINHALFNQWTNEHYGFNENFIYYPDLFAQIALGHKFKEAVHQVAINMTLSNQVRSKAENQSSIQNFIKNLREAMPCTSNVINIEEHHSPDRNFRWQHARQLIQEENWKTTRMVEEKRKSRMRAALRQIDRF